MSDALHAMADLHPHLTLLDKAATWASWGMAGAIFLTIGWMVMAPDDPRGAVSLLTRHGGWTMLLQAAGLAVVTAGLATVVAGRKLPHVGTFAAAVGLTSVSLKGATTSYLLIERAGADGPQTSLAMRLVVESLGWYAVMLAAYGVSTLVAKWCHPVTEPASVDADDASSGLKHTAITVLAGAIIFQIFAGAMGGRSVQHGQACFLAGATLYFAAYIAHRTAPVRSLFWSVVAVGALAVVGYAWARFRSPAAGMPASLPTSPFLRVLPIQFVAVGTAAVVAVFWSRQAAQRLEHGHGASLTDRSAEGGR